MKKSVIALVMALATTWSASSARAMEVSGVKFDDKVDVGGVPLVLNGAGLRTKVMLKIYVVGLYLPTRTTSADAVINSSQPRRVHLVMKRGLGAGTVWDAFEEGIEANNTPAELAALKPKLDEIDNDLLSSAGPFVGVDTPLGPLYLAYSYGEGGHHQGYLYLGRSF